MIKLQVIGNLGRDSVTNNVNGKTVINFSVAHTEKYRDAQGQQKDKTLWVECAYWTDRVGIAPYLKKGTQVYAEGTPDIRTYTTNDGRQGTSLSLRVMSIQLLGSKGEGGTAEQQPGANYAVQSGNGNTQGNNTSVMASDVNEPMDDLPF
ncbi:single-stranded DNA-binding protein [Segetibacter sp. 3557_3]|uniref:single-stranded DNA-binding protein n=1 Tax=Segetibacter sp. 3557_3 TaxID=2547429 RepID=UPI001058E957|nr:single-stranded DNA-binding protein [Segetibacter sp. 3557_3]TDH26445.1 single-stranded DNA-binding protein [Segetibacter sp. 3557_3]